MSSPDPSHPGTFLRKSILGGLFASILAACSTGAPESLTPEQQARVDALVDKTLKHMSHIPAGGFWLGDPGQLMTDELKESGAVLGPDAKLGDNPPFTLGTDNKPPRWVTLDAFSMAQYKVTYGEFDVFVTANGLPAHPPEGDEIWNRIWRRARQSDDIPAGVTWQQAKDYCQWMGKVTGLPFDLPTEAQWEYAASAGRKTYHEPYPTDTGLIKEGHNHPTYKQIEEMRGRGILYPVGRFPPSKLGLYDLAGDGFDWVNDWYVPDAYQTMTDTHNPKGPANGTEKVMRGKAPNDSMTFSGFPHVDRHHSTPDERIVADEPFPFVFESFRCAVNQPDPVQPR
ncbi:formylglycine-generating enzyme family protein [Denitromonas iodatirespirans]|uniref:SUMF1/EgtB/PvdO family nonheme iron enzyme n=1 Tax=Denitromonas iodatirespirans TaxID=2795389 RepID=A0A944DEY6_DENI1|nr:SUMF1/EgtB/PvdO family nonheme iron enzyme [Denitromonas iodatirespirans]MBT0963846.1 SUMF1/EgtB/PvdO family nonheme iron enzyme [Denitromonas iodatirespirans]